MSKYYAQVVNNIVTNVIEGDPTGRFEPHLVWTPCKFTTKVGDILIDAKNFEYKESDIDLTKEKNITYDLITLVYRFLFDRLAVGYDKRERETWPIQIEEARQYLSDVEAPTPLLDALANRRYIDKKILAQRILGHNHVYRLKAGQITGDRQYLEDITAGSTSFEQLLRIRKQIQRWQEEGSLI